MGQNVALKKEIFSLQKTQIGSCNYLTKVKTIYKKEESVIKQSSFNNTEVYEEIPKFKNYGIKEEKRKSRGKNDRRA